MTDVTWTIETADFGNLTASGVEGDSLPLFRIGDEFSLTFFFGQEITNHVSHYNDLREFARYAGDSTIDTGTDIRGVPWYRERIHPYSSFTSTLVKLVPGADVGDVGSYWAVVTGGSDGTKYVGGGERLTLSCYILAEASEYNARSDVENDLKAEL